MNMLSPRTHALALAVLALLLPGMTVGEQGATPMEREGEAYHVSQDVGLTHETRNLKEAERLLNDRVPNSRTMTYAIALLSSAAQQGSVAARYDLSVMYRAGIRLGRNNRLADQYRSMALAQLGNSMTSLIRPRYLRGERCEDLQKNTAISIESDRKPGLEPDELLKLGYCRILFSPDETQGEALALIRRAAEADHPEAQYTMGLAYLQGKGTSVDYEQAAVWLNRSRARGNPDAAYLLSIMQLQGNGMPADSEEAFGALTQLANQGHVPAMVVAVEMVLHGATKQKRSADMIPWLQQLAAMDHPQAQFALAVAYEYGLGIPPDMNQALRLYLKAGMREHVLAQQHLGNLYLTGRHIHQDLKKAAEWFHRAADQGSPTAARNMALMYEKGIGVSANQELAHKYVTLGQQHK